MNIRIVSNLLAILLVILAGFLGLALGVCLVCGEGRETLGAFLAPMGIAGAFFAVNRFFFWEKNEKYLSSQSGFFFVTLAWVCAAFLGALPFFLSGAVPRFIDCVYEAMSGFTTTGSTILPDIESLPRSLLFWRAMTHWLGGMGIVVLTVAVFPLLGFGALTLMEAEAPGPSVDKITPRAAGTARILWLLYMGLTALETVLLLAGGMDFFDALTHAMATLSTGGFSPKNASVAHYRSVYVDVVITVFMLLSGANFTLYYRLFTGKAREVWGDTELRFYLFIFAAASLMMAVDLYGRRYSGFGESLRFAGFQAASILTTTGFITADYEAWTGFSRLILFLLMFTGGCAGSTAGGVKVVRVLSLLKMAVTELKYVIYPKRVFGIYLNGQYLKKSMVYDIAAFFLLYMLIFFAVTFMVAAGGFTVMTSMATAISCLGNIGPGFGLTGPRFNFAFFPDYLKGVLCFAMLAGRLEVYTVLVLFTPAFWKK